MEILLATNNTHKVDELKFLLNATPVKILSLTEAGISEDVPETGDTLEANAILKAEAIFTRYHRPCLSDDSGLEVEALNGAPGVYSARYAGLPSDAVRNMRKLLDALQNQENRKARFRTVLCWMDADGPVLFEGTAEGKITVQPRGTAGFGYDPIFVPDGYDLTFAEMDSKEKNRLSHRAKALEKFSIFLREKLIR